MGDYTVTLTYVDSDETQFDIRVTNNNTEDRIHIERVEGNEPDPNGMMRMRNLIDEGTDQTVNARAKVLFSESSEDEILITFEFLFETSNPDVELLIHFSDVPEFLDPNDPCHADHYLEAGRLSPPPAGRPGSFGSGRFAVFHKYVSPGNLNFASCLSIHRS